MVDRMEKIDELVGQEVAKELQKLFPEFFITVTEVEVAKDLGFAKIWIASFKGADEATKLANTYAKEVQKQIAKRLTIYRTPKIRFYPDNREIRAQRIEKLVRDIKKES